MRYFLASGWLAAGAQEYFRRPRRHGDLRQNSGRRAARRRGLRPRRPDAAFPGRPAGRHLLRSRHLQFASLRDGSDGGVSRPAGLAGDPGLLPRPGHVWNSRAALLNQRLEEAGVQVRVANMSSVWTVCYLQPSRYHWMLQYYLRAEDLALSWVGTGRLIFSLDYTDAAFR